MYRPCRRSSPSAVLVALMLPGCSHHIDRRRLAFGQLNVRSAAHKAALIHDTIADQKLDVLCTTSTVLGQSVDGYVELFNSEVERILDKKHAPLKSRTREVGRKGCRWLSADAREAKRRCRCLERRYR